jgi:hypothetical protein
MMLGSMSWMVNIVSRGPHVSILLFVSGRPMSCTRNRRHIDNLAAEKFSSLWSMNLLLATNGHLNDFSAREDEKSKMDAKSGPDHVSFVYLKRCRSYL